jgi:hypothetical protein
MRRTKNKPKLLENQRRMEDLAEVQIGYQFRGKVKEDPQGSHAVVQIKNIANWERIAWDELARINPIGDFERYLVTRGDVLFLARGKRQLAFYVDCDPVETLVASYFYLLRADVEVIVPAYLAWYLNQRPAQRFFYNRARGSRILMMAKGEFLDLPVTLPSLEDQRRIVTLEGLARREVSLHQELIRRRRQLVTERCLACLNAGTAATRKGAR